MQNEEKEEGVAPFRRIFAILPESADQASTLMDCLKVQFNGDSHVNSLSRLILLQFKYC